MGSESGVIVTSASAYASAVRNETRNVPSTHSGVTSSSVKSGAGPGSSIGPEAGRLSGSTGSRASGPRGSVSSSSGGSSCPWTTVNTVKPSSRMNTATDAIPMIGGTFRKLAAFRLIFLRIVCIHGSICQVIGSNSRPISRAPTQFSKPLECPSAGPAFVARLLSLALNTSGQPRRRCVTDLLTLRPGDV